MGLGKSPFWVQSSTSNNSPCFSLSNLNLKSLSVVSSNMLIFEYIIEKNNGIFKIEIYEL